MRTGKPIVYTSADSVFQIAAHEDVIPIDEQYRICEIAFELVARGHGVGRVIARPFVGAPGSFTRTANRHDYALEPMRETLLDLLTAARHHGGLDRQGERSVRRPRHQPSDAHRQRRRGRRPACSTAMQREAGGLIFANLVDFDTLYGHRNDVAGYAANLERFDARLPGLLGALGQGDLLIITADHGNDPTTPSTDHSREYVPVLLTGAGVRAASTSARARRSPTSARRWRRTSASARWRTAPASSEEIVAEHP